MDFKELEKPFRVQLNQRYMKFFRCPFSNVILTVKKPISEIIDPKVVDIHLIKRNIEQGFLQIVGRSGVINVVETEPRSALSNVPSNAFSKELIDEQKEKIKQLLNGKPATILYFIEREQNIKIIEEMLRQEPIFRKPKKARPMILAACKHRMFQLAEEIKKL